MLILIVDDDAPLRSLLASILRDEGHEVLAAGDGYAALEVVMGLSQQPDLILLDLMLPKMSGFEFCNKLQDIRDLARVPILVITAVSPLSAGIGRCVVSSILHKPFSLDTFLTAIARFAPAPHHQRAPTIKQLQTPTD